MFKKYLYLIAFAILSLSVISCSEDDDNPIDNNTGTELSVGSKTITGKLHKRQLDLLTGNYSMLPWDGGATTMKASYGVDDDIATAQVAADGSFTLILPEKVASKRFFSPTLFYGITPSPSNLTSTIVPLIISVKVVESGVTLDRIISIATFPDDTFKTVENEYDIYCSSHSGTIKGTATVSGDYYDLSFNKGWNFVTYTENNNKFSYNAYVILPNDVYFY